MIDRIQRIAKNLTRVQEDRNKKKRNDQEAGEEEKKGKDDDRDEFDHQKKEWEKWALPTQLDTSGRWKVKESSEKIHAQKIESQNKPDFSETPDFMEDEETVKVQRTLSALFPKKSDPKISWILYFVAACIGIVALLFIAKLLWGPLKTTHLLRCPLQPQSSRTTKYAAVVTLRMPCIWPVFRGPLNSS